MFNKNEFNAMLARKGMTRNDLAYELGISRDALYRRIGCGEFNMNEVEKMFEIFGEEATLKALFNRDIKVA